MVGTASFLALWILSATPGVAISTDRGDGAVVGATFQDTAVADEHDKTKPAPLPPERLPPDPAYDAKPPTASDKEGIPGLPPLPPQAPAEGKPGAPSARTPTEKAPAERKPNAPSAPPPPREIPAPPSEPAGPREDAGETICTDEGPGDPCGFADASCSERCPRRGWFDGLCVETWLDQGATINTLSPRNRSNGPVTFNDRSNNYQLNQMYLRLQRDAEQECDRWGIGGRLDLLYGTDSIYTEARGLELTDDDAPRWNAQRYGLAMPELYAEVYCPWGNGLSMKLGHIYSILGYECVTAPNNFFYSHSYLFQYAEPKTFTGLLGATNLGDFTIQAGMSRGDDNWDDNNNDLGVVGSISWTSSNCRTNIALAVNAAREQADPSSNVRTVFSLVIQQKLGDRWQYVIQYDYGSEPGAGLGNPTTAGNPTLASWYGIDQYLFRTINERWKAGLRFEWFRDENGSRVPGAGQTGDYFELTAGLNWTPNQHVVVRPELRWDWTGTPDYYPFGDGTRSNQVLLDCDLIVRF